MHSLCVKLLWCFLLQHCPDSTCYRHARPLMLWASDSGRLSSTPTIDRASIHVLLLHLLQR